MSLTSSVVSLEICWLALAIFLLLFGRWRSIPEAFAVGTLLTVYFFSTVFQVSFLLTLPELSYPFEFIALLMATVAIARRRDELRVVLLKGFRFLRENRVGSTVLLLCGVYLLLLAWFIPPSGDDNLSYNLTRVFLFQQEHSLLLRDVTNFRQAMFPVGADILAHAFLRFRSDYGIALFSFLAYIAIVSGSYALARRVASEKVSLLTALVIAGMPGLCFQATNTKNDIFLGASAVCCFLMAARLRKRVTHIELMIVIAALGLGVSAKTTFWAFALFFVPALALLIRKTPGWGDVAASLTRRPLVGLLLFILAFVSSQAWLYAHNVLVFGDLTGNRADQMVQNDGLWGGLANVVRYTIQCVHLFPFDWIASIHGWSLGDVLGSMYESWLEPIFGRAGLADGHYQVPGWDTFRILEIPHQDLAWYGPLGLLLVIPGTLLSLIRGSAWLRTCALSLLVYSFSLSFVLIWVPWNSRFFLLAFAGSGACVGFLLHSLKLEKKARGVLLAFAIVVLIASCSLNYLKPLVDLRAAGSWDSSIWARTIWGRDRLYFARAFFGGSVVERFDRLVEDDATVALMTKSGPGGGWWTYHFFLKHPGVLRPTEWSRLQEEEDSYDYLLCLGCMPADLSTLKRPATLLWHSEAGNPPGVLVQLGGFGPGRGRSRRSP